MSGTSVLRLLSAARFKGTDAEADFCSADKNPLGCASCFFFNLNVGKEKSKKIYADWLFK